MSEIDIDREFDNLTQNANATIANQGTPATSPRRKLRLKHKFLKWLCDGALPVHIKVGEEDEEFFLITAKDLLMTNTHDAFILEASRKLLGQQRTMDNTKARRRLEGWARKVIIWYLGLVGVLVVLNGVSRIIWPDIFKGQGFISDTVMTVILSTTTINIIGLGVIVLRGHFTNSGFNNRKRDATQNQDLLGN